MRDILLFPRLTMILRHFLEADNLKSTINAIRSESSEAITIQLTVGMLFDFQSCNFPVGQHNNQSLLAHRFRN